MFLPLLSRSRPPRPGDILRTRGFKRFTPEGHPIGFRTIWFNPAKDGLARVTAVSDDLISAELWGFDIRIKRDAGDPRPLTRLGYWLAPERIGEGLVARRLVEAQPGRAPADPAPRVRDWRERTRGPLPLVQALGGRHVTCTRFLISAWLRNLASGLCAYPMPGGFAEHGPLLLGIGRRIRFRYSGKPERREMVLDQIWLAPNHNLHLIGTVPSGERRTFVLDRMDALQIEGFGPAVIGDLEVELSALHQPGLYFHVMASRLWPRRGLPPPPRPGWLATAGTRFFSGLNRGYVRAHHLRRHPQELVPARVRGIGRRIAAVQDLVQGWRTDRMRARTWPAREAAAVLPVGQQDLGPEARWRAYLRAAADRIAAGLGAQVTVALPARALLADPVLARHFLRSVLAHEARALPPRDPRNRLIARILAISPPGRKLIPEGERRQAKALYRRLERAGLRAKGRGIRGYRLVGADRVTLLCAAVLDAIWAVTPGWRMTVEPEYARAPDRQRFRVALNLFVADWQRGRYQVRPASAERLRWIAAWGGGPRREVTLPCCRNWGKLTPRIEQAHWDRTWRYWIGRESPRARAASNIPHSIT